MNSLSTAAVAVHRLGLGEHSLSVVHSDPVGWLLAQIGPADPQPGEGLATLADGVRAYARFQREQRTPVRVASAASLMKEGSSEAGMTAMAATPTVETASADRLRDIVRADVRASLAAAMQTQRPFAERLALFWANHFTVSLSKPTLRGMVGAFEREAIRPNIAGPFERLLKAAVTHGAMLQYLDNDRSMGPQSRAALQRTRRLEGTDELRGRPSGLNENLAREILELHTLGAASKAYTQNDVTALAAVLTGWRLTPRAQEMLDLPSGAQVVGFDANWHQPGSKTVLGQRIPEGPGGLDAVLSLLVRHPATAQFVALKLARHFVSDEPPPELVHLLADRFKATQGDLAAVAHALLEAPSTWQPAPTKLKTPSDFVVSSFRLLSMGSTPVDRLPEGAATAMGQRLHAAPSPAGWPDRQEDWLGPDAVWKRVEWAARLASRVGGQVDARALAREALGPRLSAATAQQIERAADGPQALALLLMSPEFQRR
jgi:uncharacterized protein (DUF1800 family)